MVFHIAVCSGRGLRSGLERQCMEYFARRQDACIVQQLPDADALLRRDTEGERFDLYLIELGAVAAPAGLSAAAELRRREPQGSAGLAARTGPRLQRFPGGCHAVSASAGAPAGAFGPACPRHRAGYGPAMTVVTAEGLRALAYAQIEYLECTHHVVHFHLLSGEDVVSLSAAGVLCRGSKAAAGRRAFCSRTAPMWSIWRRHSC